MHHGAVVRWCQELHFGGKSGQTAGTDFRIARQCDEVGLDDLYDRQTGLGIGPDVAVRANVDRATPAGFAGCRYGSANDPILVRPCRGASAVGVDIIVSEAFIREQGGDGLE